MHDRQYLKTTDDFIDSPAASKTIVSEAMICKIGVAKWHLQTTLELEYTKFNSKYQPLAFNIYAKNQTT